MNFQHVDQVEAVHNRVLLKIGEADQLGTMLSGNLKKGLFNDTLQQIFEAEIEIPRDRNAEFEPRISGKYEKTSD